MAVLLPFFGYGQIINESIVRASIASNIPTNANKQITAAMLRPVLGQIVSFVKSGANGVSADSLAAANYIPFFKTTGIIANSPFRVASNNVGLGINPVYPLQVLGALSASQFRVGNTIIADTTATETRLYRRNGKVGLKLGGSNFTNHYENYIHVFRLQDSGEEFARLSYNGGLEVRALGNRTLFQAGYIVTTDTLGTFVPSYSWAKDFTFATDPAANYPTTRMVIKVNGLVGIGRTNPVYGLDVARSFRADSSAYLATISANRVGIGNTSPLTKLHVSGSNDQWISTISSTDGVPGVDGSIRIAGRNTSYGAPTIQARSADGSIYRALALDALAFNVKTSGTERFTIDQFGNVGIATTNPSFPLDVNGTFRTRGTTLLSSFTGNVGIRRSSPIYMLDVNGSFRADSSVYLATVDGNVGIGTPSANTKFDVRGSTAIKGVHTAQDYRFLNFTISGERIGLLVQNDTYNNSTSSFESHNGIVSSPEVNATSTGGTLVYGLNTSPQVSSTVAGTSINATGGFYSAGRANAADVGTNASLNGIVANATHNSSAGSGIVTTNAYGVVGRTNPQTGTMTNSYGVWSHTNLAHFGNQTATIGTHYGLYTSGTIGQAGGSGVATMTTFYDAYLAGATVNSSGTLTNRWGLYQANSTHKNYFAGNTGFNTNNPQATVHINGTMILTPMAASSVPTGVEGMLVCVNSTNGTFTSTGVWLFLSGAWTKL